MVWIVKGRSTYEYTDHDKMNGLLFIGVKIVSLNNRRVAIYGTMLHNNSWLKIISSNSIWDGNHVHHIKLSKSLFETMKVLREILLKSQLVGCCIVCALSDCAKG